MPADPIELVRHLAAAAPDDGAAACRAVVLVRDGRIAAIGARLGGQGEHAAVEACRTTGTLIAATAYVMLGGCRTCGDLLKDAGVTDIIEVDVLDDDVADAREMADHYRTTGRPFITLTAAVTWDGKMASRTQDSKWISSDPALRDTHRLRSLHRTILVGSGTVRADNPRLTSRIPGGRHPIRLILDSQLATVPTSHVASDGAAPTWFFTAQAAPEDRRRLFEVQGASVFVTSGRSRTALLDVLSTVADQGVDSMLVEGGGTVHAAFFDAELVDQVVLYIAPKLVGGREAPTFLEGEGRARMADAAPLDRVRVRQVGPDLRLVGCPRFRA